MSQYYKVRDHQIYIKLEKNKRVAVGLNFGSIKKSFVECKSNCNVLEKGVNYISSNKKEFTKAMTKAIGGSDQV